MKKLLLVLALVVLCIACTACTSQPSKESSTPTAKSIAPIPSTLEIDSFMDATVAVSFEAKDLVTASAGIHSLFVTVYDYELFDMVDISTMAVGDTIVLSKKDMKIETLEKDDHGGIIVNGGVENEGANLATDDNTVYYQFGMDGIKTYFEVGQTPLNISDDFKFVDNSDLENLNQEHTYDEFAAKLKSGEIRFDQYNTTAVIVGGDIVEIALGYRP